MILAAVGLICGAAMADDISGTIKAGIALTHAGSGTASTLTESLSDPWKWGNTTSIIGTNGSATGLGKLYVTSATIVGSGTNSLDFYGSLTDSFGVALNFSKIKLLFAAPSNSMATVQTVTIRPAAANGFTNWTDSVVGVTIRCGGAMILAAPDAVGYVVSNGVCDAMEVVNNSTNAATVKIVIAGE